MMGDMAGRRNGMELHRFNDAGGGAASWQRGHLPRCWSSYPQEVDEARARDGL